MSHSMLTNIKTPHNVASCFLLKDYCTSDITITSAVQVMEYLSCSNVYTTLPCSPIVYCLGWQDRFISACFLV